MFATDESSNCENSKYTSRDAETLYGISSCAIPYVGISLEPFGACLLLKTRRHAENSILEETERLMAKVEIVRVDVRGVELAATIRVASSGAPHWL